MTVGTGGQIAEVTRLGLGKLRCLIYEHKPLSCELVVYYTSHFHSCHASSIVFHMYICFVDVIKRFALPYISKSTQVALDISNWLLH